MVNERLCENARLAFFFASPRHFDLLDCETETSKCFECEREVFRVRVLFKIRAPHLVESYENELV